MGVVDGENVEPRAVDGPHGVEHAPGFGEVLDGAGGFVHQGKTSLDPALTPGEQSAAFIGQLGAGLGDHLLEDGPRQDQGKAS